MRVSALLLKAPVVLALGASAWWACSSETTEPPAPPTPSAIVKVSGDAQNATVDQELPDPIVAQVNDQFGAAMSGVSVTFQIISGGGSVGSATATTDASGQVSTTWRLGTASGPQELRVTAQGGSAQATFTATAQADAPTAVAEVSGNNQVAPRNAQVGSPLVVQVQDQFGNGVPSVTVMFAVTSGGGSVTPDMVDTGANGQASTTWTLGDPVGAQTVEATVSVVVADTIFFSAQAVNFNVTQIAPDPIVEGQSATITGEGFDDQNLSNNVVIIDGVQSTVTAATPTQLTVDVPLFDCRPERDVGVEVGLGGFTLPPVNHRLEPAQFLSLAVGEYRMIQNPADFCFQLQAASAGNEAYLIGVGTAAEAPTLTVQYTMTSSPGAAAAPPAGVVQPVPQRSLQGGFPFSPEQIARLEARRAHMHAELALRAKERDLMAQYRAGGLRAAAGARALQMPPNVGDTIMFRVPDLDGANLCSDFTQITTVVRAVGSSGVFVTDINNPAAGDFTDQELQDASATFDNDIFAVDTLYFGPPSDLDMNQVVFVVLSIEVNRMRNGAVAGFVTNADLFDRVGPPACPSSDEGEIFYSHVPDPNNTSGTGAETKAGVLSQMPSLIAHEFTHIIQFGRRLNSATLSTWESEGQATLAEEVVGHSVLGNAPGQDLTFSDAIGGAADDWYNFIMVRLAYYYGWDPPQSHNANTPEDCTLFGNHNINDATSCQPFWFYGASWSFQRYVLDRFGPAHPDGEDGLAQDWIDANPNLEGVANVEALLGVEFDSVMAKWSAMHWADGRIPGIDASLQKTSWNLFAVFDSISNMGVQIEPVQLGLAGFTNSRNLRGGGTAYTRISQAGAHPALAIRVRGSGDAILSSALRPHFWIIREQ